MRFFAVKNLGRERNEKFVRDEYWNLFHRIEQVEVSGGFEIIVGTTSRQRPSKYSLKMGMNDKNSKILDIENIGNYHIYAKST